MVKLEFKSRHDFLIGIDSDGCVFDTMEVKQKLHFHPLILEHWHLHPVEKIVRRLAEHVNLTSQLRGSNRFVALLNTFELLRRHPGIGESGVALPDPQPLRQWIESGVTLTNDNLAKAAAQETSLKTVLEWSQAVNRDIAENMREIPPFPGVRPALERMRERADRVVVSLTPHAALAHEWELHGLRPLVDAIAGLEVGTKPRQLRSAMEAGEYAPERVLLIGDAPGDLNAARECGVCFYPTVPGEEQACWEALLEEDLDLFFAGRYREEKEASLIAAFEARLSAPAPEA